MGLSIKFKNILDVGTTLLLRKLGFQKFDDFRRLISVEGDPNDSIANMDLWLIPASKYDEIPKGYMVTDIFGNTEAFEGRKTCCKSDVGPDGLLPIGVLRPAEDSKATEATEALRSIQFVTCKTVMLDGKVVEAGTECYDRRLLKYAVEMAGVPKFMQGNIRYVYTASLGLGICKDHERWFTTKIVLLKQFGLALLITYVWNVKQAVDIRLVPEADLHLNKTETTDTGQPGIRLRTAGCQHVDLAKLRGDKVCIIEDRTFDGSYNDFFKLAGLQLASRAPGTASLFCTRVSNVSIVYQVAKALGYKVLIRYDMSDMQ